MELKISAPPSLEASEAKRPTTAAELRRRKGQTLLITQMTVINNPAMTKSEKCLFVFSQLDCPNVRGISEVEQWVSAFPFEVGILPLSYLGQVLSCRNTLDLWSIQVDILPAGETRIRYRFGIDAVWTGKGLPQEEMTYYERLGLEEGTSDMKMIRRAYHKKSLQWHPDRWSALTGNSSSYSSEVYTLAVSGAFELIAEAYKSLTQLPADDGAASKKGKSDVNGDVKSKEEQNPFF